MTKKKRIYLHSQLGNRVRRTKSTGASTKQFRYTICWSINELPTSPHQLKLLGWTGWLKHATQYNWRKVIHINEHNLHINYCTNPKLMRIHTEIMWLFSSNDWVSSTLGHGSIIWLLGLDAVDIVGPTAHHCSQAPMLVPRAVVAARQRGAHCAHGS